MPVAISGIGGAFSVVAVNSWMNQPQGFTLGADGAVTDVDPLEVIFNPAVPYEVPHMILAAYLVTCFLVASVYAVGMLRGRRDRHHRLGLLIPLTVGCILAPIQFVVGDTAAREIAKDQPIKFAAMECVQTTSHRRHRVHRRPLHRGRGQGWDRDTRARLVAGRLQHRHRGDRPRHGARQGPAAGQHAAALGLRRHGRRWIGPDRARGLVRVRLVAPPRHPADEVVPARRGRIRGGDDRGSRKRLDRHRGRPPAVDRLRGDAHQGRRHGRRRDLGDLRPRARPLHGPGSGRDPRPALDGTSLARRGVLDEEVPYGPGEPAPAATSTEGGSQ